MKQCELSAAIPQLPSGNLDETAAFFEKFLGFQVVAKMQDHGFLIVRRGPAEIHFWQAQDAETARKIGEQSSCYIRVSNIPSLFQEFQERCARFRYPLEKKAWGMNEMQIDDPFGNAIRFGEAF